MNSYEGFIKTDKNKKKLKKVLNFQKLVSFYLAVQKF